MFVIIRQDGWFVNRYAAHGGSYTEHLQYAKCWRTREAAEKDRCPDNERVISVESIMEVRDA